MSAMAEALAELHAGGFRLDCAVTLAGLQALAATCACDADDDAGGGARRRLDLSAVNVQAWGRVLAGIESAAALAVFMETAGDAADGAQVKALAADALRVEPYWWLRDAADREAFEGGELPRRRPALDERRLALISGLEPPLLRFLADLVARGYSEEAVIEWSFHPALGPRLRAGAGLLDAASLPPELAALWRAAQQEGGGGGGFSGADLLDGLDMDL